MTQDLKDIQIKIAQLIKKGIKSYDDGKFENAIRIYDEALSLEPNNIVAIYYKYAALIKLGKDQETIESYDKMIAAKPDFLTAFNETTQKLEKAIDSKIWGVDMIGLPGDTCVLINAKAKILEKLGRFQEAITCYEYLQDKADKSNEAYCKEKISSLAAKLQ